MNISDEERDKMIKMLTDEEAATSFVNHLIKSEKSYAHIQDDYEEGRFDAYTEMISMLKR